MEFPVLADRVRLHLDAHDDDTFTLDAEGRVTQWRDKSLNGLHFDAIDGYGTPLKITGGVRFDANASGSTARSGDAVRMLRSTAAVIDRYPIDIFVVLSNVNTPNSEIGPILTTSPALNRYEFLFQRGLVYRSGSWSQATLDVDWSAGRGHLLHAMLTSSQQIMTADVLNSVSNDSSRMPQSGVSYLGVERPASSSYPSYKLRADLHELIAVPQATDSERIALNLYLASKWPVVPPLRDMASRAIDLVGAGDPRVVLFDWDNPSRHLTATMSDRGNWRAAWPDDVRPGVYYISRDTRCLPVIHGPYITE